MNCLALLALVASLATSSQQSAQSSEALNDGVAWMGQFEFEKAADAFTQAIAIDPTNQYAKLDRAIAVMNQTSDGSQERAIELLAPLLPDPNVGLRATYCTALAQLFLGRPQLALPLFQGVSSRDPADAHAAYYAAQCLELDGKTAEALALYEQAARLDPFLRSAVLGMQRSYARLEQPERATEMLELFDRLAKNARSTLAEFKYTRMGALGEAFLPSARAAPSTPRGDPFAPAITLDVQGWPKDYTRKHYCGSVDLNDDGRTDLLYRGSSATTRWKIIPLLAPAKQGDAWIALPDHPIAQLEDASGLEWGDFNNDGRIDVVLQSRGQRKTGEARASLEWLEQQADGQWTPRSFGLAADTDVNILAVADLDHDGDLDLLISQQKDPNERSLCILYNKLDGSWEVRDLAKGSTDPFHSAAVFDLDRDGDLDIVAVASSVARGRAAVYLNDRLWSWSRDSKRFGEFESHPTEDLVAFTRAADGMPMLAATEFAPGHGTGPYNDLIVWEFGDGPPRKISQSYFGLAHWIAVVDVTGSGAQNILVGGDYLDRWFAWFSATPNEVMMYDATGKMLDAVEGPPKKRYSGWTPAIFKSTGLVLMADDFEMRLPGANRAPVATVDFRGRIDPAQQMRTNASGIGTTAVARIGDRWAPLAQMAWMSRGQATDPSIVGLASASKIDFVSIEWPDGVSQTERSLTAGTHTIVETQRQISSCPVIFTWNGERMQFITDCLGVGGLGYLATVTQDATGKLSPVYAPPRPWERVALPSGALAAKDGQFEIALSEPMEELTALDAAHLIAYDLPAGWCMALDERMGISDPQPTGAPIFYRESMLPARAHVTHGARSAIDQTAAVRCADFIAVDPGPIDSRFIGRTAEHFTLELVFASPIAEGQGDPVLLMDGWIEYPYCQTNFAMWQARATLSPPSFEALDPATGQWQSIVKEYGYPAGMPREAAFGLDRALLPAGCTTLRISTNHELYIDRCRIVWSQPCPQAIERTAPLLSAEVRASGFARRTTAPQRRPIYDYESRAPLWDCKVQLGFYTATDIDCSPLLSEIDDAVAIFAGGEEVRLNFDAALAPLAEDWSRTFVLDLNGWCKDMDLLTGNGERVDPLPLRDPESSLSPRRDALHSKFNTRYQGGR